MGAVAIVSGSGLDLTGVLDQVEERIPFSAFPSLPQPTVPGHQGQFDVGTCGGRSVILQRGRIHLGEGHPVAIVQQSVDILASLGADTLVFTNAAGGLKPEMTPGSLMAIDNVFLWPFASWPESPASVMPTFTLDGCDHLGTYIWVHGPAYETPDEIHVMQRLGGSAVGMSTAPEIVRCRELGLDCAALSCITNNCCQPEKLTHEHVLTAARSASARITERMRRHITAGSGVHETE